MVVGEIAEGIDLLVVGGGPGGYAAALRAASLGREVVLVERHGIAGLGGVCLHVGCIPSKALLELAHVAARAKTMQVAGIAFEGLAVDLARFQSWKQAMVGDLAGGVAALLRHRRVRIVEGELAFNKPNQAAVATPDGNVTFFEFDSAIVATGSRPVEVTAFPVDGSIVLDSSGALALDEVPPRLAILGADYIGLELATAFAKLGARVTIVEVGERILPEMEALVTRPVVRSLERSGVELLLGAEALGFEEGGLVVRREAGERRIPADKVVVAAGRRPNTDDLGLAAAAVSVRADGTVEVDASRRATPRIAAIGDITRGPALAHKATAEAEVAADTMCGRAAAFSPAAIPLVVFTDPEIAVVGLTEEQARAEGMQVVAASFPLAASGRAKLRGSPEGFVRLIIDKDQDVVVGVHMVGASVSELAGEAALAVEMMASPEDLAGTIHPHSTISEGLREAAAAAVGRPLHMATR
jgi:dihydrolipoamide dehydrogenase